MDSAERRGRRRMEKAAGEPFGPFGPPRSSVSPGSEFWESGPAHTDNSISLYERQSWMPQGKCLEQPATKASITLEDNALLLNGGSGFVLKVSLRAYAE